MDKNYTEEYKGFRIKTEYNKAKENLYNDDEEDPLVYY